MTAVMSMIELGLVFCGLTGCCPVLCFVSSIHFVPSFVFSRPNGLPPYLRKVVKRKSWGLWPWRQLLAKWTQTIGRTRFRPGLFPSPPRVLLMHETVLCLLAVCIFKMCYGVG